MKTIVFLIALMAGWHGVWAEEAPPPSVLYVASERHTSLALNDAYFPQFARVGFGTSAQPWHPWFGTHELQVLLYLPGYEPGQPVAITPHTIIGSRFNGNVWANGFEALRSFDRDHNGIVERDELNDLYVWTDADSSGTYEPGMALETSDTIVPCRGPYTGFDLRQPATRKEGYARAGLLAPFSVFRRQASRIHLLDLAILSTFAERSLGYLSYTATRVYDPEQALSGEWRWEMIQIDDWQETHTTWQQPVTRPTGRLLLAVQGQKIRGVVQYEGRYADTINLPLQGQITGNQAEWRSISPLGLTRSQVTLAQEYGRPVLRGRAWSNRNGAVQRWSWKAYYAKPLE